MKITEEKSQEYAETAFAKALKAPWPEAKQAFADAYIAGSTEALAGQWRSVEDELPDGTPFCVTMADEESRLCLCHFDGDVFIEDYSGLVCAVKYWMPIPFLPPKDESHV